MSYYLHLDLLLFEAGVRMGFRSFGGDHWVPVGVEAFYAGPVEEQFRLFLDCNLSLAFRYTTVKGAVRP